MQCESLVLSVEQIGEADTEPVNEYIEYSGAASVREGQPICGG